MLKLKFPSFSGARNLENEKNSEKNFENFATLNER